MYPQPNQNLTRRTHGMTDTPKKRGRPFGVKNKPKRISVTATELQLAKKLGISKEQYVDAINQSHVIKRKKVDWEKLARQLEAALESQLDDYTILETKVQVLEKEVNEFVESHRRHITVISYLETKLGLNSI